MATQSGLSGALSETLAKMTAALEVAKARSARTLEVIDEAAAAERKERELLAAHDAALREEREVEERAAHERRGERESEVRQFRYQAEEAAAQRAHALQGELAAEDRARDNSFAARALAHANAHANAINDIRRAQAANIVELDALPPP